MKSFKIINIFFLLLGIAFSTASFAMDMVMTNSAGQAVATARYETRQGQVIPVIEPAPGYVVAQSGQSAITVNGNNSTSHGAFVTYTVINPSTGDGVSVSFVYKYQEQRSVGASQPLVQEFGQEVQIPSDIKEEYLITKNQLDHIDRLIADDINNSAFIGYGPYTEPSFFSANNPVLKTVLETYTQFQGRAESFRNGVIAARGELLSTRITRSNQDSRRRIDWWHGRTQENIQRVESIANSYYLQQPDLNFTASDFGQSNQTDRTSLRGQQAGFLDQLRRSRDRPTFKSEHYGEEIEFDRSDAGDMQALRLYGRSFQEMSRLRRVHDRFHELKFSQGVVETRQKYKHQIPENQQSKLTNFAAALINNSADELIQSLDFFLAIDDFGQGYALSLLNNMNPLGSVFPIEANNQTTAFELGQSLGDLTSLFVGALEVGSGLMAIAGGSGLSFVSAAALPATGGLSAVVMPVSASGVVMGMLLTSHGANSIAQSFQSILSRLSTLENMEKFRRSQDILRGWGRELGRNSWEFLQGIGDSIKSAGINSLDRAQQFINRMKNSAFFRRVFANSPEKRSQFYVNSDGNIVPSTAYRHIHSSSPYLEQIKQTGRLPDLSGDRDYWITFDRYESMTQAQNRLQLPRFDDLTFKNDGRYRIEFDTLNHLDHMFVPTKNQAGRVIPEPYARLEDVTWGFGGGSQMVTKKGFQVREIVDLLTGEIIFRR